VMDDPGGVPLDELLLVARNASALADAGGQPLERFPALASSADKAFSMRLAISLSTAIRHLHQRGLIHVESRSGSRPRPESPAPYREVGKPASSGQCPHVPAPVRH
jgi:hypothetical protein